MVRKTDVITIRCTKEEKDLIVKEAEKEEKTISEYIITSCYERSVTQGIAPLLNWKTEG